MISLENWKIMTPLQKLTKNVADLGKIIVATVCEKLQLIAQSGHTAYPSTTFSLSHSSPRFLSGSTPSYKCSISGTNKYTHTHSFHFEYLYMGGWLSERS